MSWALAATVHRLVAEAFLGPSEGRFVNHKDGNRANACASNLEYCNQSENMKHAFATGLQSNKGERHSRSRLTDDDIRAIRSKVSSGMPQKAVAKLFGVDPSHISRIAREESWSHVVAKVG